MGINLSAKVNIGRYLIWLVNIVVLLPIASSIVLADGVPDQSHVLISEGAAGKFETVGTYPDVKVYEGNVRTGISATLLPNGNVIVYGAAPSGGTTKDGEVILDRKKRMESATSVTPAAVRWDSNAHSWKDIGRPPQCPDTNFLHTATLLPDDKILFAGGICDAPRFLNESSPVPPAYNKLSLWNDVTQKWESAPSLSVARFSHTATLLSDGSVLVVGGEQDTRIEKGKEPVISSVERYNPSSNSAVAEVTQLPDLHYARARHTATLLPDGRVVVVGGMDQDHKPMSSVEIWDPKSQAWSDGPVLKVARYNHAATLLNDGSLMILGGIDQDGKTTSAVEILRAPGNEWAAAAPLLMSLRSQAAATLGNGDVLVVGTAFDEYLNTITRTMLWQHDEQQWKPAGILKPDMLGDVHADTRYLIKPLSDGSALIFDQSLIFRWVPYANNDGEYVPTYDRRAFSTVILNDGRILVAGGRMADGVASDLAEIYDPSSNRFYLTGRMNQPRMTGMPFHSSLSSVVTNDGRVVIAGGWVKSIYGKREAIENYAEAWDPKTGQWNINRDLKFNAQEKVYLGKLNDGRVLFFASNELSDEPVQAGYRALVWNPLTNSVTSIPVNVTPRTRAAIAILKDGRVLIAGGQSSGSSPNPTAEIWDSKSGEIQSTPFPGKWDSTSPQTLVLRNGNVLLVSAAMPHPLRYSSTTQPLLWNIRDNSWSSLPALENNWPITELNDGSLIAWGADNINPEFANILKPGAQSWEHILRFPQNVASVIQLPSNQLLALSLTEPNIAIFDDGSQRWRLRLNDFTASEFPSIVTLKDNKLAVLGTIFGRKEIIQVWDSKSNSWAENGELNDVSTIGKIVVLPSGNLLQITPGSIESYVCQILRPDFNGWKPCGVLTKESKNTTTQPYLGVLDDGRAILFGSLTKAYVYDESAGAWTEMQIEWNEKSYTTGIAIQADKPFARIFDPINNVWFDASIVASKYYSSSGSNLSMLWDPARNHWAYIGDKMGANAFWLPDGCAISGPPFKIFNPIPGTVTEHRELELPWMRPDVMSVMSDGTVVLVGTDATGAKFFHSKATCNGFDPAPSDILLMPAHSTAVSLPALDKTQHVDQKIVWKDKLRISVNQYRWVFLAALILLIRAFLRRYLIPNLPAKYPNNFFDLISSFLNSGLWILLYGAMIIGVYVIFKTNLPEIIKSQSVLPCRYIGAWSKLEHGRTNMITLYGDGRYKFGDSYSPAFYQQPASGYWDVMGDYMIWYYQKQGEDPVMNKFVKNEDRSFTLLEYGSVLTRYELVDHIKTDACTP